MFKEKLQELLDKIGKIVGEEVKLSYFDNLRNRFIPVIERAPYIKGESNLIFFQLTTVAKNNLISQWYLKEFPGCCGICVSTGVHVSPPQRNKGINKIGIQIRELLALNDNFTVLICTDVKDNYPERLTLNRAGFENVYEFNNKRTGNDVYISLKKIQ
jgi:hypothetical protein